MRKIKFRAWDKKNKRWLSDADFLITADGLVLLYDAEHGRKVEGLTGAWREDEDGDIVLVQSTGLHDKNGKEIYEGDFLIDADDPEPMRHRIVWLEDEAKFELKTLADEEGNWDYFIIDALADLDMKDFEIIGNIYENPKLLK